MHSNLFTGPCIVGLNLFDRAQDGLGLHHHPGPSAIGHIVGHFVPIEV